MRQVFVNMKNEDGSPVDLTGCNYWFEGLLPDGVHRVLDAKHGVALDPVNGQFRFDMPKQAFAVAGSYVQAFFRIMKDGASIATLEFDLQVLADKVISGLIAADYNTPFEDKYAELGVILTKAGDDVAAAIAEFKIKVDATLKTLGKLNDLNTQKLQTLATAVGVVQAQIDAGNVITRKQFDTELATNQAALMAQIKAIFATIGDGSPKGSYATLADLNTALPSGATGIYLTQDTGHWYYYLNSKWNDGGVYQSTDIADGSIVGDKLADGTIAGYKLSDRAMIRDQQIGDVHYETIVDSNSSTGAARTWYGNDTKGITFDKKTVAYSKTGTGDNGIIFPVSMTRALQAGESFYIRHNYWTVGEALTGIVDMWVLDKDKKLIKQYEWEPLTADHTAVKTVISYEDLTAMNIGTQYYLLFAIHGGAGTLAIDDLRAQYIEDEETFPELVTQVHQRLNNSVADVHADTVLDTFAALPKAKPWNDTNGKIFFDKHTIAYNKSNSGDAGIKIPVQAPHSINPLHPLCVNLNYWTTNDTELTENIDVYLMSTAGKLSASLTRLTKTHSHTAVSLVITADQLIDVSLGMQYYLLFAVHGGEGTLAIDKLVVNYSGNAKTIAQNLSSLNGLAQNYADPQEALLWNSGGTDLLKWNQANGAGYNFDQTEAGDRGFMIPIAVPTERLNALAYVDVTLRSTNIVDVYLVSLTSVLKAKLTTVKSDGVARNLKLTINPADMMLAGSTGNFYLLFATHTQGAKVQLRDLYVGSQRATSQVGRVLENLTARDSMQTAAIGEPTDYSGATAKTVANGELISYQVAQSYNAKLTRLAVTVPSAGTYTFEVGQLDQNSLLVNPTSYQVKLAAGYNQLDVTDQDILIHENEQLFMVTNQAYTDRQWSPTLIQDTDHTSTVVGYPGDVLYAADSTLVPPFSYEVVEVNSTSNEATTVDSAGKNYLVGPDGVKFRFYVGIDKQLKVASLIPSKVNVLGNSLTKTTGNIGMCASDQYHDYYYLLQQALLKQNASLVMGPRNNVSDWESATTSTARQAWWDNTGKVLIDADADLVIVQLGDNVNTDAKKATFADDAATLITNIRVKAPNARVLWVAGWFVGKALMTELQTACAARGAELVDISALANIAELKGTLGMTRTGTDGSTWVVTNPGEAAHPGDKGMAKIAAAIMTQLEM